MTKATADGPRSAEAAYDEDTIEFQLGSELVEALARAAETARELHSSSRTELGAGARTPYEDAVAARGYEHAANEHAPHEHAPHEHAPHEHASDPLTASAWKAALPVSESALPESARQDADQHAVTQPSVMRTDRKSRMRRWVLLAAGLTAFVLAGVAALQWPAARHPEPLPPPPPPVIETPEVPAPQQDAQTEQPQLPPVRYRNPFDRSEVFEFPAGTSVPDAQQAVADILLQRAQERRAARLLKHHRAAVHSAAEDTSVAQNSASRRGR
ncbi:MAG: hypothetical protein JOZ93_18695 [Sinobacteraceae bacterium]|nr:hypothetical protein [Nevskiaceae bacterium]